MEPETDFEGALDELERIVGALENGAPPLAEALASYERGIHLLAQCHRLLDGAERTVAVLSGVDDAGAPVASPFDATATADRELAEGPKPRPRRSRKPDDGIPF